ncbi:MAG: hypothetical protein LBQ24_06520 [Candidatus Peribacteria bacterium]|nr:hypothetical protein [Candidatus Peribacteria bacterium]
MNGSRKELTKTNFNISSCASFPREFHFFLIASKSSSQFFINHCFSSSFTSPSQETQI